MQKSSHRPRHQQSQDHSRHPLLMPPSQRPKLHHHSTMGMKMVPSRQGSRQWMEIRMIQKRARSESLELVLKKMARLSLKLLNEKGPKCKQWHLSSILVVSVISIMCTKSFCRGENGRLDGRTTAAKAAGFIASAHKLGPKANQGAINEKLRALDRTGKSCRKWQKTGFKIKSFTGRVWEVPSWRAPEARSFGSEAETKSDSNEMSKDNSSSNIGSESKTPAGGGGDAGISSPAVPIEA